MKKIVLGFVAIGLFTLIGCKHTILLDKEGNTYKTVKIGTQEWMAENLKTTKYSDGTPITNGNTNNAAWYKSAGAWCRYYNENHNDSVYGKLYNWYAVETGKLCPTGWHVPTDGDWTVLADYLSKKRLHNGEEGKALKSKSGWEYKGEPYGNGTDDFEWNGLPGGRRFDSGQFKFISTHCYLWSSSEKSKRNANLYILHFDHENLQRSSGSKQNGLSVRCLRD